VTPLARLISAPNELLSVVGLLRKIGDNTREMAESTRVLEQLRSDMSRVAETTAVLGPMDERMAAIEAAMPVLVEVQKSLARLPDTAERLDAGLAQLMTMLDRLFVTIEDLHRSIEPLARVAQRLPGGGGNRS
jgi:hypothetical protein